MTLNCIIVDDEPIARGIVRSYIAQIPFIKLAGEFSNAFDALQHIKHQNTDLVILDINMPRLTGLGMLRTLEKYPSVIITSAHKEYALDGFELSVTDYLLKPFSFTRFAKAVDKVVDQAYRDYGRRPQTMNDNFLVIRSEGKFTKIFFKDIMYVEAHGNYIQIHCLAEKIMSKQTMAQFEQQLPDAMFIRVHKSYIIATNAIKSFKAGDILVGQKSIPVGKVYRKTLFSRVKIGGH